jgi:hypothetical protein
MTPTLWATLVSLMEGKGVGGVWGGEEKDKDKKPKPKKKRNEKKEKKKSDM